MFHTLSTIISDFGLQHLIMVWLIIIFAAIMRAFTGFGFALTAVPVFSLFMAPTHAVVLSIMLTLAVSVLTLRTFWGKFPVRALSPMISFSLLGTVIGAYFLGMLNPAAFQLWVGLAVISVCLVLTFYHPPQREPRADVGRLAGLASGLMNGLFAIPGPPMVVYAMATQPNPEASRALLMTFFLFSASFGFISYSAAGYVGMDSLWLFLLTLPAMLLGDRLGYWLFAKHGTHLYRRVALVVLFTVGISITARALLFGS